MSVLFVLLPLALAFAGGAVWLFVWAVRSGQFDDLETPAVRMLLDEEEDREKAAPVRLEGAPGGPTPAAAPPDTPDRREGPRGRGRARS